MVSPSGRGFPGLPIATIGGTVAMVVGTAIYSWEEGSMNFVTPDRASYFALEAEIYLLVLLAGVAVVALDLWRVVGRRVAAVRQQGFAPLSPTWLIPYVLSKSKYRNYFLASTLLYGLFYAFVTSMIVYQPGIDFVREYGASFPSAVITPCCGTPLFAPVVTVYVVNHLGLLLIPLTGLLLVVISVLVGLNSALAVFAFNSRVRGVGRGWLGGLGAVVGLFTGCPTCAGLFFANVLGGAGAVTLAAGLASYQPLFILVSLPVLAVTPYLTSRSLAKVFREGCVIVGKMP
ncbi:MAG TPA: hypothetical protein VKF39_05790 [Nitrososphaerales archaeon]|nr:hypothetical protein [Nitrososphaerales archaeon]